MPLPTVAVTESNLKMSAEVKDELAADGCYDLTHEGAVIGLFGSSTSARAIPHAGGG